MNPIRIKNINDITGMMIIDPVEYNRLIQENTELHNKISQLTNESTKLNTNILEKNLEIEMLRKENTELREKIKILEDKIDEQNQEITKLKKENENRNNKEILKQIRLAIQDLNSIEQLEKNLSQPYNNALTLLRNNRNNDSHFIIKPMNNIQGDRQEVIEYKKYLILQKLKNLSQEIITRIETTYGNGLIKELITYLDLQFYNYQCNLTQIEKDIIEEWWE
jgi:hypothetical protein